MLGCFSTSTVLFNEGCSRLSLVLGCILAGPWLPKPQAAEPDTDRKAGEAHPQEQSTPQPLSPDRRHLPSITPKTVSECRDTAAEQGKTERLPRSSLRWPVSSWWQEETLHLSDFGDNCRDAIACSFHSRP